MALVVAAPAVADHDCGSRTSTFGCRHGTPGNDGDGGNGGGSGGGGNPAIFDVSGGTHPDTGEFCWQIRGPQTVTITCLGETITATARYVVRWGDGTETATTSRGGPWPDGDLEHTYTEAGAVTIAVDAYWSGMWNGSPLPEIPVPTRAELPLEVRQVQAVRDR